MEESAMRSSRRSPSPFLTDGRATSSTNRKHQVPKGLSRMEAVAEDNRDGSPLRNRRKTIVNNIKSEHEYGEKETSNKFTKLFSSAHVAGRGIVYGGLQPQIRCQVGDIGVMKDHWSSEAYSASASFVPKLTQTVLRYLDPKPTERVLDVGCGDGKFTSNFIPSVGSVLGIDASPSMIETAKSLYGSGDTRRAEFRVVDCRYLQQEREIVNGAWDKVISNAALHWILRDETTRLSTLQAIHDSLKPGGTFVFEMGGHGNVGEVVATLLAVITRHGKNITLPQARESSPWFFPSETWMRNTLEKVGFRDIEKLEVEYRPTKLTAEQNGNGGVEGWMRLMGAQMLDLLDSEEARDAAVKEACELLETIITREEDGSKWFGYVRLRGVARKSS